MADQPRNMSSIGYLYALGAALCFGSVSTVGKVAMQTINPLLLSCLSYLLAAIALTPFARKSSFPLKSRTSILFATSAICGAAIAPTLYFLGLQRTSASDTAILSNGEQVFTIVFAILFFKERPKKADYIAILMILTGVIIVATNLDLSRLFIEISLGNLLVLGATVFWSIDNNVSKILTGKIEPAKLSQVKSIVGFFILAAVVIALKTPLQIGIGQIPDLILIGTIGFGMSLYFFLKALQNIGTVKTIVVFSTAAVFGLFFAAIFLQEAISVYKIAAIIIVMSGIYLMYKNDNAKRVDLTL
ncbi:MAG: DMT family transporter [Nitrososphaeria archaeon]|jgi:drug/metabolite transporter (DMT)-like permease